MARKRHTVEQITNRIKTSVGRVHFLGVDTPERGKRCFTEVTETTRRLAGSQARLEGGPRLTDRVDRRLAYVYDMTGNSIDVQLVVGVSTAEQCVPLRRSNRVPPGARSKRLC